MSECDSEVNYFRDVPRAVLAEFVNYHEANPELYDRLVELALHLRRAGREHYGIWSLWGVLRYHTAIQTSDYDYKLNNNYTPLYARLLMQAEPELRGFFETRRFRRVASARFPNLPGETAGRS